MSICLGGNKMPFSEEPRSYSDTRKRTSSEYVKFSPDYRVVLRILNPEARTVWKHWIPEANGGRGLGAVCPNVAPGLNVCPVEQKYSSYPKDDAERREHAARKRFVVNVLDRTPYTTCNSCSERTPAKKNPAGLGKVCINCGQELKGNKYAPLNKVKILEQGPNLFNKQLNVIENMQKEDTGKDITEYDIVFTTTGIGRDRTIQALPQDPVALSDEDFLNPETGEAQALFDLELLAEPASSEEVALMLQGATIEQLNAIRGIE